MIRLNVLVAACLGASVCCTGCSQKATNRKETIPVTVKVTMAGSPVEGASVAFVPTDKGKPSAAGTTDASGTAKLQTYAPGDGAVAGSYKVTITKVDQPPASKELDERGPPRPDLAPKPKFLVPQKYSDATTTDQSAEVSKNKKDFTFDLKK